jgi:hypothetical protein
MDNDGLDLSRFDELLTEYGLTEYARMLMFEERTAGCASQVNQIEGTLTLDGIGSFDAHLLGTFSKVTRTFLWSWANPDSADAPMSDLAHSLREWASDEGGMAAFTERKIAEDWVGPTAITTVASALAGGLPAFWIDLGQGVPMLLVEGAEVDVDDFPPTRIPGLLYDFQSNAVCHFPRCVACFFDGQGYDVDIAEDRLGLTATSDDGEFVVSWNDDGVMTDVEGDFEATEAP